MELRIITYNTHGLPWSRDRSKEISEWLSTQGADILCLQEVFTQKARDIFVKFLNRHGYEVCIPDDSGVTLLGSGLLTCFKIAKFQLLSHVFCSFQQYHNVEWFANKGFHCVRLIGTHPIAILNTHTQSNTEVSFLFGKKVIHEIRAAQFEQMYNFSRGLKSRVLIVGDVNCDISPFHGVRFLSFLHNNLFHKSTFSETGEDLDQVGWIPDQYAKPGCSMCDIERFGPRLLECKVHMIHLSDHYPVEFHIRVPRWENLS